MTTQRFFLLAAGLVTSLLAGCAQGELFQSSPAVERLMRRDARANPAIEAQVEALAQAGAPAIIAQVEDRDAQSALFLVQSHGATRAYLSADGSLITLEQGFLSATRGLGGDLMSSAQSQTIATVLARREGAAERRYHHLDGDDQLQQERFHCRIENRGPREIPVIGGAKARTTFLAEICVSANHQIRNLYWVGNAGQLVQSRQWAGHHLGTIAILH